MAYSLFKPNNHSRSQINWLNVDYEKARELTYLFFSNYAFHPTGLVQQVDELELMSHNFRIEVEGDFGRRFILFRKNLKIKDENVVSSLSNLLIKLKNKKVPVPSAVLTRNGQHFFCHRDYIWQSFEFISGEHFHGSLIELKNAAGNIACLHSALRFESFPTVNAQAYRCWRMDDWQAIFKLAQEYKDVVDHSVMANKDFLLEQAALTSEDGQRRSLLAWQLIHGDIHPLNTIFECGELKSFLDFEKTHYAELALDIGKACHRLVRQFVVFQGKPWQESLPEGLKVFFEEYRRMHYLCDLDLYSVPKLIRDDLVSLLWFCLKRWYFDHDPSFLDKGEFYKFIILLKEAGQIEKIFKEVV